MRSTMVIWADDEMAMKNDRDTALLAELQPRGIDATVKIVGNAADAVNTALGVHLPMVIIMDIHFGRPDRPGFAETQGDDVLATLAEHCPGIPVIIYSARVSTGSRAYASHRNVRAVIEKGEFDLLAETVYRLLALAPPVIVHMSDVHFGGQHAFLKPFSYTTLREWLEPEVEQILKPARPNLLVVSGDCTTGGKRDEFDDACRFLQWLSESLGLRRDAVAIVPGNHDVQLTEKLAYKNYWTDLMMAFYGSDFDDVGFVAPSTGELQQRNLVWVREPAGVDVVIAGLASTTVTTDEAKRIKGFDQGTLADVTGDQLSLVQQRLASSPERSTRIAVLHHHMFPVPSRMPPGSDSGDDDSVIYGQPRLLNWFAENGFQLVLHGHTHYPSLRTVRTHFAGNIRPGSVPVHIAAAGTVGASAVSPGANYQHYYLLSVSGDEQAQRTLSVRSRVYPPDGNGWQESPSLSATIDLETGE